MPRCMMHGVRGYKKKKYWDSGTNHQNIMMTRSGLTINTRPKSRQLPVQISATISSTQVLPNPNQKPTESKTKNPTRERSMSNLSLVTRVALLNEGVGLDLGIENASKEQLNGNNNNSNTNASPLPRKTKSQAEAAKIQKVRSDLADFGSNTKRTSPVKSVVNQALSDNSSSTSYSEISGISSDGTSASDVTYDLKTSWASAAGTSTSSIQSVPLQQQQQQQQVSAGQPKSILAQRHPVLVRYISRDEVVDAAASLLSLASSCPTTPNSSLDDGSPSFSDLVITDGSTTSPETSSPPIGETQPLVQVNDRESVTSDSTSVSQSTNDDDYDDASSVTSQSSSDDTYVQLASQEDETFLKDLTRFQLECHAYAYDSSGNKIHRCTVCERVFTVFYAFKVHVNTHVRPKNRCSACGKIFSRSWLLKGHMRTHTGERPYTCKYNGCNKKFADKSNLRSHVLIHTTKDKAFVCGKCKRAFAQKRYLHKHELEVCKI